MPKIEYADPTAPRDRVTPPFVLLEGVRIRLGLRQVDVADQVAILLGTSFTKGALSAIETGQRGASSDVLSAIQTALGLRPADLRTEYEPSHSRRKRTADPAA